MRDMERAIPYGGMTPNVGTYAPPREQPVISDQEDRDAELLRYARDAFTASNTYFDASIRPEIERDLRQFQSLHAADSKYLTPAWKGKSDVFRPKTRAMIRKGEAQAAAAFFSSQDVVGVQPANDSSESARAGAIVFQALLQHYLSRKSQRWFQKLIGAYQVAQNTGIVISYQSWDTALERPDVRLVPVENFRFDPGCDWTDPARTSPYLIEQIPMYLKDIHRRIADGKWREVSDSKLMAASGTTYDSIRSTRDGQRQDPMAQSTAISEYTIIWVNRNIIAIEGEDLLYYTAGTTVLLSDPEPVEARYPHGRPYAVGTCLVEAFRAYPDSLCKLTRGMQRELNEIANLRIEHIKQVIAKRFIVERNRNVDLQSLTRNVAGSVTLVSSQQDVRELPTSDMTGSSFQEQDRLQVEMDDLGGVFAGSSVAANRNLNETVGGMSLLNSSASQIGEYQLRTLVETWVEVVLQQLVVLIRAYCDDPAVLAMAGQDPKLAELGYAAVTEEMLQAEMVVTVNVGLGAVDPMNKVSRIVFGLGKVLELSPQLAGKINAEEVIKEILGNLGYRDGLRFFEMEDQAQTPDPMQQLQLALLKAQVDKTTAESVLKNIEALYSAMNTGVQAVQVPGVTPVADAIAKSAGFVDRDAPPIYPQQIPMQQVPASAVPPQNTSPMFPPNPERGMMAGMESGRG